METPSALEGSGLRGSQSTRDQWGVAKSSCRAGQSLWPGRLRSAILHFG